jgi:hypothetical protein
MARALSERARARLPARLLHGSAPAIGADPEDAPGLGLLLPLCVTIAAGVLLVSLADAASREGHAGKQALFWAGMMMIVGPVAVRLCGGGAVRRERIWLVVAFAAGLYLVKVAYSPTRLAFSDEFVHWRSVHDDLATGHLFSFNPLLPEASRYPGLGGITTGVVRLTGLPITTAALVVIGSARIVLVLAIVLVVERLAGSMRVAALAGFVYAGNPNFLYWSAQFSYESLALPLVMFTVYLVVMRSRGGSWRVELLACASALAVVITHHLSSYFLAGVLVAWSALVLWRRRRLGAAAGYSPHRIALVAVAGVAVWLGAVASVTGEYLGSIASSTSEGLFNVLTGATGTRKLFTSGAEVAPLWERALGILAVLVTLAALAYGAVLIWSRRRERPLMLVALVPALAYPVLLPLRFVGSAAETANRSTEFLFLGLGAVLASVAVRLREPGRPSPFRGPAVAALATLVIAGGIAVSWQYSERLPEDPGRLGAAHEVTANAFAAYRWAEARLGPGRRFSSDFLDQLGLAAIGRERPLYGPIDDVRNWQVMAAPSFDPSVRRAIAAGGVEYVLVDRRLGQGIPTSGFYFDKGEPHAGTYTRPLVPGVLGKFDRTRLASRIYDNGTQQIYAVGGR